MNKLLLILTSLLIVSLSMQSQSINKTIEKSEIEENCYSNRSYYKAVAASENKENAKGKLLIRVLDNLSKEISVTVSAQKDTWKHETTLDSYLKTHGLGYMSISSIMRETTGDVIDEKFNYAYNLICNQYRVIYQTEIIKESTDENKKTTYKEEFSAPKDKNWYNEVIEELENIGFEFHYTYEDNIHRACIAIRKDLINQK